MLDLVCDSDGGRELVCGRVWRQDGAEEGFEGFEWASRDR